MLWLDVWGSQLLVLFWEGSKFKVAEFLLRLCDTVDLWIIYTCSKHVWQSYLVFWVSSPALEFKSRTEGRRAAENALQTAWEASVLRLLIALGHPVYLFKGKRQNETKQHKKLKPPSRKKKSLSFNDFAHFIGYCSISGRNWTGALRWPILPAQFIYIMKCVALTSFSGRIRMLSCKRPGIGFGPDPLLVSVTFGVLSAGKKTVQVRLSLAWRWWVSSLAPVLLVLVGCISGDL